MQIMASLTFEKIIFCNKASLLSLWKCAGRGEREGGVICTEGVQANRVLYVTRFLHASL